MCVDTVLAYGYIAPHDTCPGGGMVDALASGASGRKAVEVRVLSWAPYPPNDEIWMA